MLRISRNSRTLMVAPAANASHGAVRSTVASNLGVLVMSRVIWRPAARTEVLTEKRGPTPVV